jgi:iron(III) transport system substrate-binding protein
MGLVLVLLGAVLAGSFAPPAVAQSSADIAKYKGPDRQAKLEAGARKEGELLIYATATQADPMFAAFMAKYPFIKFNVFKADAPSVTRKMVEEYKAGHVSCDALDFNIAGLRELANAGIIQPYYSPQFEHFRKEIVEPNGYWVLSYESYLSVGYNTKLVSEADAPKTLDGLLDPKWKGKMGFAGTSTLANWIGAVLKHKDEAYLRKLSAQNIRVIPASARAVANMVISGELWLSPTIYSSHVANSREQGAPIAWRAISGVYSTTGGVGLAARAPHPHAALLFIDFVLSREGQEVYRKLGYASGRIDMPYSGKPETVYYFADDPDYMSKYEVWNKLGQDIFSK